MIHAPYEVALESRAAETRSQYRFHTADGVVSKRSFRDAELLLLEALADADLGRLLCPEANYGVLGTVLSAFADHTTMTESSARAATLCERNAAGNDADAAVSVVADLARLDARFDTVAYAPKPYTPIAVGKQRIADALSVLRPGGSLYLTAAKRTGLTRYADCLKEIAASVTCTAERDEWTLLEATRPRTFDPPSYVTPRTITPTVNGERLSLVTVPGVFAASELDAGTRLLAETVAVADDERVLDLCCGYGTLGIDAARRADCEVWFSDDDRVATACAERSLRASGVDGTVVTADCIEGVVDRTFDRVLCNPPTHAGSGVLSTLFAGAHRVLAPRGRLCLVHHRSLDLREHLREFGTIETLRTGTEHVVLAATP